VSALNQPRFPPRITTFPDEVFDALDLDRWSGAPLSDDQIRALAVGAWYADNWDAYHDTVLLIPDPPQEKTTRPEKAIDALATGWDITGGDDALRTIERLHRGMHAPTYELVHPLAMQAVAKDKGDNFAEVSAQHRDLLREIATFRGLDSPDALVRPYDAWLQALKLGFADRIPRPLVSNIVAWDLVRAAWIARAAHTAGYIDEPTAWERLMAGLAIAQRHYRNWRQLGIAYVTGATYWQATVDLASAKSIANGRLTMILRLWERPLSPWRRLPLHPGDPVFGFSAHHY
jgi:hypothetical protein